MSYAIIGFGNIGQALAKAFARSGIEVSVATTRDRKALHLMRPRSDPRSFHNTGGSRQGGHRLSGCPLRITRGCREGAAELEGKDHHRCDQRLRRVP